MKKVAAITATLCFGILAVLGFGVGSLALGSAAIAIGVAWLVVLLASTNRKELSLLLGLTTVIAVLDVLYGASIYLTGTVIVLSITCWEFSFTEGALASFPAAMTKRFVVRHVVQIGVLGLTCFALLIIPTQIHVHIGFGTALGLGLGSFLLFAVLLILMGKKTRQEG